MTPERWQQVDKLFEQALETEPSRRSSFLDEACAGDPELRREVESLLAYDGQAQQLLDRPALQMTAEKLADEPPSLVGRKLGPYQIQGVLGAGGMGEVYKARDTRLNRTWRSKFYRDTCPSEQICDSGLNARRESLQV